MAATNMKLAGLEIGCKVDLPGGRHGIVKEILTEEDGIKFSPHIIVTSLGTDAIYKPDEIARDYEDAQAARQRRFSVLLENYPGDAGVPEESDTIERYCCVEKSNAAITGIGYAFVWDDDFDEVCKSAANDVFEDWWPEAVFDLDTGERIEIHMSNPIITRSEDQGTMVNVLQPENA